jgi:hypothetical protein
MTDYFKSVEKALHKYYGKTTDLYESTRKDKKFMVINPQGKRIHFGAKDYLDYHLDQTEEREERRKRFRNRNRKWADADKWTPAHLAFYVLW